MFIKRILLWVATLLFMVSAASSQVNNWTSRENAPSPTETAKTQQMRLADAKSEITTSGSSVATNNGKGNAYAQIVLQKSPTKEIVYCCVEGPEVSTLIRGKGLLKNGKAVIQLPEHYGTVTGDEGLTAQITAAGICKGIYIRELSTQKLVVEELNNGTSNVEFYYQVQGIKKGFENYTVFKTTVQKVGPECR